MLLKIDRTYMSIDCASFGAELLPTLRDLFFNEALHILNQYSAYYQTEPLLFGVLGVTCTEALPTIVGTIAKGFV